MKWLLTIGVLLFTVGLCHAQFSLGPKAGVTFSTFSNIDSASLHVGFLGGMVFDYALVDRVSFQQDILLSRKGLVTDNKGIDEDLYFMEVTFMPKVFLALTKVKPFINAGPYLGFLMFGKGLVVVDSVETNERIKFDEDARSVDFGFNFGAGIEYKGLLVELRSGIGIKDYNRYPGKHRQSNRVFGISVAYLFDLE